MPNLEDVTVIIKTFQRPRTINRLMAGLRQAYPAIKIIIADDSDPYIDIKDANNPNTQIIHLPFDIGACAGRNAALAAVQTPYFIHMDDDFLCTAETRLELLLEILQAEDVDILGGLVYNPGPKRFGLLPTWTPWRHIRSLDLTDGTLTFGDLGPNVWQADFFRCHHMANFWIARTDVVRANAAFDEQFKVSGHADFFLRMKHGGVKVGYTSRVSIRHNKFSERDAQYRSYRGRGSIYRKYFLEKHNIHTVVHPNKGPCYADDYIAQRCG